MNILVTGGAGFVGSYVCEKLLEVGHKLTVLDMASSAKIEHLLNNSHLRFVQDSVLNYPVVEKLVAHSDMVIHLAAIADPKRYVSEPLTVMELDLRATLDIMRLAAQLRTPIVFASTSEIYGRNPHVPWKEDDDRLLGSTAINRWCYSTCKAACEHYAYALHQQEGLCFTMFRIFNAYGPRLDDLGQGRVIPIFLKQIINNEPITIHGDGSQTRSFCYIDDTVDAIVRLAFSEESKNDVFNIGSARETSIRELAELMCQIYGVQPNIRYVPHTEMLGTSYEDIPRRVPDLSKIKERIGWEAKIPLEEGLRCTIEYYRRRKGL